MVVGALLLVTYDGCMFVVVVGKGRGRWMCEDGMEWKCMGSSNGSFC
jgi:hypothetical protein